MSYTIENISIGMIGLNLLMMLMCLTYFIYQYAEMIHTHNDLYESQRINNREFMQFDLDKFLFMPHLEIVTNINSPQVQDVSKGPVTL